MNELSARIKHRIARQQGIIRKDFSRGVPRPPLPEGKRHPGEDALPDGQAGVGEQADGEQAQLLGPHGALDAGALHPHHVGGGPGRGSGGQDSPRWTAAVPGACIICRQSESIVNVHMHAFV